MAENPHQKLQAEQIARMCQRAFGSNLPIESVEELGGGTFNETYLIRFPGGRKVILRIAPPPRPDDFWDDVALMRREHNILPFFASIAALMPQSLLADFTHQIVPRDYLFQTFIEGERWSDIEDEIPFDQSVLLWRQCGQIVRRIHTTAGDYFGHPLPGRQFAKWSEAVIDRLARIGESGLAYGIDTASLGSILEIARANGSLLDEIETPYLLHGDLWTFNLLVQRGNDQPSIVGVLDADRAWWGDPAADWLIFLLSIRENEPEWQERIRAFYDGYGPPEMGHSAQIRQKIYRAMLIGEAAIWSTRNGDENGVSRSHRELAELAHALSTLPT